MIKKKKRLIKRVSLGIWFFVFLSYVIVGFYYDGHYHNDGVLFSESTLFEFLAPIIFTIIFGPFVSFYVPIVYIKIFNGYIERTLRIWTLLFCSYLLHAALIFLHPFMLFGYLGTFKRGAISVLVPSIVFVVGWYYLRYKLRRVVE